MRPFSTACRPLAILIGLFCAVGSPITALAATKSEVPLGPNAARSYWVVTRTGQVCHAGEAQPYGNGHGTVVGIKSSNDGHGYWLVLKDGKTEAFGDAKQQKYAKTALMKWTGTLGVCKSHVVGAAAAKLKPTVKKTPAPPTKTTSTPPSSTTSTATSPATTTPDPTTGAGADTTPVQTASTNAPPPVTTTTPLPVTTTPTTTTLAPPATYPTISTTSVPGGEVGVSYSNVFQATGGAGGYSWSKLSGGFPTGLTLNADGTLSGTPTQAGSYSFSLLVMASDGGSAEQTYSMTVLLAVAASPQTLPVSEAGIAYGASLSATSGARSYTWTLASGSLPGGVQLSSSGAITGTPASAGTYSFTATVTDALGGTSSQSYSLIVDAQPSVATSELPDPVQTLAYDQQLATANGSGSDTWQVRSGTLPAGLSLSSSGEITGTATTPGGYNVTVQVTDALGGTATKTYSGITATWHFSPNWSGYAARAAAPFTSVSGTFNVPTLLPGVTLSTATGIWVGIDGADNSTLLQAGVSIGNGLNAGYSAWTEEVPQQAIQTVSGFKVNPGDSITVSIDETDIATHTWTLSITDNTTGQTYSTSEVYTGAGETAEWIAEAPTDAQGHLVSMAIWTGAIDFTHLSASQPTMGLDYMTLSPGFVSGGAMNSLFDSGGFAVTDDEQVPAPLPVGGSGT